MRLSRALFVVMIILTSIIYPVLAIDDYGEDEDYLGQVVDDYENDGNIAAMIDTIHNETLDCMELNYTIGGEGDPAYENLSAYVEVDSAADLTVMDRQISWVTMRRDAASWVVYDFGTDYFGDFQCNFTLDFSAIDAGDDSDRHIMEICAFSNTIGSFADTFGGDLLTILPRQVGLTDNVYRYDLQQFTGGVEDFAIADTTSYAMPKHYGTIERTGNTITLRIYTDEARTTLIETLTDTGSSTKYRYFHAMSSYDSAGDGADHSTGIVANVTFGRTEGYVYLDGHYYTVDMLDGDTGIVLMYNATVPIGTGITLELSEDNSTWVDHNNASSSDTLITGFESLDLRDLNITTLYMRFNMTNTNPNLTPRMYQVRLVTITEVVAVEEGDTVIMGGSGIFWIILIIVVPIVAYMVNKK